jgi:hypothetical protein
VLSRFGTLGCETAAVGSRSRGCRPRRAGLVLLLIAGCLVGVGCGGDDSAGSRSALRVADAPGGNTSERTRPAPAAGENRVLDASRLKGLVSFARRYLVNHVCPDAPTPPKLVVRILGALRTHPRLTRGAAAESICNKTRG